MTTTRVHTCSGVPSATCGGCVSEPLTGAVKNQEFLECGCLLACDEHDRQSIAYCPLHAAAGAMRNLIPRLIEHVSEAQNGEMCEHSPHPIDEARALLARLDKVGG